MEVETVAGRRENVLASHVVVVDIAGVKYSSKRGAALRILDGHHRL